MKARYEFDEALHPLGKETCDVAYQNYLRAYYAGCALTGILANSEFLRNHRDVDIQDVCIKNADALIEYLNKKKV